MTHRLPDRSIVRVIWPALAAAVLGLFPFTVYSTFLGPISRSADSDEALIGGLRGLGGIAALVTGVAVAPLLPRIRSARATALGLLALAAASLVGTIGTVPALVVFCLVIGSATAVLTPTLLGAAAGQFADPGDAARAATLLTACQSLAAVFAAPVIGVLSLWDLWRGPLWITAILAVGMAVAVLARGSAAAPATALDTRGTLRELATRRDLMALAGIAMLRTTSFMGYLAFLAAQYSIRFDLDARTFTLVWTLSGASFFLGNYLAGRLAHLLGDSARGMRAALVGALGIGVAAVVVVFHAQQLAVALASTIVMGLSHAVVAALVTTGIVHRAGPAVTSAFSVTAAGMSLGVFVGATVGGVGLAVAGPSGLAVALGVPTLLAVALVPLATTTPRAVLRA